MAGADVTVLADLHQASPAAGNEGAWSRTCNVWRAINTARPVGRDEVLILADFCAAVKHGGVSLWRETVLVSVAADAGHALEPEIEELRLEAGPIEEWNEE